MIFLLNEMKLLVILNINSKSKFKSFIYYNLHERSNGVNGYILHKIILRILVTHLLGQ